MMKLHNSFDEKKLFEASLHVFNFQSAVKDFLRFDFFHHNIIVIEWSSINFSIICSHNSTCQNDPYFPKD